MFKLFKKKKPVHKLYNEILEPATEEEVTKIANMKTLDLVDLNKKEKKNVDKL